MKNFVNKKLISALIACCSFSSLWSAQVLTSAKDMFASVVGDTRAPLEPMVEALTSLQKKIKKFKRMRKENASFKPLIVDYDRQIAEALDSLKGSEFDGEDTPTREAKSPEELAALEAKLDVLFKAKQKCLDDQHDKMSAFLEALKATKVMVEKMSFSQSMIAGDPQSVQEAKAAHRALKSDIVGLVDSFEAELEELVDEQEKATSDLRDLPTILKGSVLERKMRETRARKSAERTATYSASATDFLNPRRYTQLFWSDVGKGLGSRIPSDEDCINWASRIVKGMMRAAASESADTVAVLEKAFAGAQKRLIRKAGNDVKKRANDVVDGITENLSDRMQDTVEATMNTAKREAKAVVREVGGEVIKIGAGGAAAIGAVTVGVFAGYKAVALASKVIDRHLNTPTVIEATNIVPLNQRLRAAVRGMFGRALPTPYPLLSDVVLDVETAQEFETLKFAINNVKKNRGIFRNLLLWGSPGTGKTMSARALANETDCYWALLTGSSLFKMKPAQALQEIDAIFKFAEDRDKPVILIIDEADALFRARGENMTEGTLKVLTHIMQKMGTESNKYMVVAITNQPAVFDEAMRSRFPKQIEVRLPNMEQRTDILKKYIARELGGHKMSTASFDDELVTWIAAQTKGFSGRSLMYLIVGIRDAFAASRNQELTREFVQAHVLKGVEERQAEATGFQRQIVIS